MGTNYLAIEQLDFLDGGHHICTPLWQGKDTHGALSHKLYWCLRGSGTYTLGNKMIRLSGGRVYLIPSHIAYSFSCAEKLELFWFHFEFSSSLRSMALSRTGRIHSFDVKKLESWLPSMRLLSSKEWKQNPALRLKLESLVVFLFAETGSDAMFEWSVAGTRLQSALEFLDQNCLSNPSLEEVARVTGYHPVHFHRLFRKTFGCTLRAWIEKRRMQAAHDLLLRPSHPIKDIASQCGFADIYYFSRAFKRCFGRSPSEYRRSKVTSSP